MVFELCGSNRIEGNESNQIKIIESDQIRNCESNPVGNGFQHGTVDANDGARFVYLMR